jgi:hypothetical protein
MRSTSRLLWLLVITFICSSLFAQQTGSISGKVTADGSALPGVTVEARSNVLPTPRVTETDSNGEYHLPALLPGSYTLSFSLGGMQTVTRKADVQLNQNTSADVAMGVQGVSESIIVTAQATMVDKESTALTSGLSNDQITKLPVTQDYKDLQKLIPGVQVTSDQFRGPSAGASGQDNVYMFDGANVTMPLFGIQVAEPATHDIAQVTVIKGGAKAVDFDRAGGFLIDSVSKSGTNKFSGELSYQMLDHSWVADQTGTVNSTYLQDRNWTTFNIGGPIISNRLYFYASYYRPIYTRSNQANLYGDLPKFESKRNEEFGKLTYTPTESWLLNGSYRYSKRDDTSGDDFGSRNAGTTGNGSNNKLQIGTLEGSKVINARSFATFKYYDFRNPGFGTADNLADVAISTAPGTKLDINNLDKIGRLTVPTVIATNATQTAFVQPFIDKYGYTQNGVKTGGGKVGFYPFLRDDDSFFRKNAQLAYNYTLGSALSHDLHFGYQRYEDSEDRFQTSNGWGDITIPGSSLNCPAAACGTAKPAYFVASVSQQTTGTVPTIHSEFRSQNIELNDTMHLNDWAFNVGVLLSNDTLYGQGLASADNIAGFVKSPGTKYKMYNVPFSKGIQPRLGVTWAYNGSDTVYTSYAKYNLAANSDARAASWDRNLVQNINVYFDQTGTIMGVDPNVSSSGKLFVQDLHPPQISEYLIGTSQQITNGWSGRLYGRYRKGEHYWEDTNNNARIRFGANVPGVKQELYISDLTQRLAAIGSGSTYVITELDGAFTKYYEASAETEWHGRDLTVTGSYTWSHYYGNFDQDNTTAVNDASVFIGSSFIGDGAGRQLWNNRYGDLRGDRRHQLKAYATYALPWHASAGAFGFYQSGQPYELWSFLPYVALTTSTSDSSRYAEPAGRRHTPSHQQMDLNYTQNIPLPRGLNFQLALDVFNVFNKQTGYNYENRVGTLGKCNTNDCIDTGIAAQPSVNAPFPRSFYAPRRYQLAARVQF